MKKILLILFVISIFSCKGDLKTEKQKFSYSVGYQIANDFKRKDIEVNNEALVMAFNDVSKGNELKISEADMRSILTQMSKKIRKKQQQKMQADLSKSEDTTEGKAYLELNKKKSGVKITSSGLQYKVLKQGSGALPKATDIVKVHYKGTLIDGKEFDSSYKRKQPAQFPLGNVISGWTEGLQLMKVGSKYEFTIPSRLAYGASAKPTIPANSVLIFQVELLEIVKK